MPALHPAPHCTALTVAVSICTVPFTLVIRSSFHGPHVFAVCCGVQAAIHQIYSQMGISMCSSPVSTAPFPFPFHRPSLLLSPPLSFLSLSPPSPPSLFPVCPCAVPCTQVPTLPPLSFTIEGRTFTLLPRQYVLQVAQPSDPRSGGGRSGGTACFAAFVGMDFAISPNGHAWILGDTFLMAYHSIFHFGKPMRVGFATSR
ncbi:unnamed protein product [Closterium sp. NIES-54]